MTIKMITSTITSWPRIPSARTWLVSVAGSDFTRVQPASVISTGIKATAIRTLEDLLKGHLGERSWIHSQKSKVTTSLNSGRNWRIIFLGLLSRGSGWRQKIWWMLQIMLQHQVYTLFCHGADEFIWSSLSPRTQNPRCAGWIGILSKAAWSRNLCGYVSSKIIIFACQSDSQCHKRGRE